MDRRYISLVYTCYHFAAEVWKDLTDIDLSNEIQDIFSNAHLSKEHIKRFNILSEPISPCLVVMQRGRTVPHIGVYVDGGIIHIHGHGVEYQNIPTATRGFHHVRYFTCKS